MSSRIFPLYRSPAMQQLLQAETAAFSQRLRSHAGRHALQLGVCADDPPPPLPLLQHWVSLHDQGQCLAGDLRLDSGIALPFQDESFALVCLKHALDVQTKPLSLLAETVRLLAPGGILVVSGLHPLSAWAWWARKHGPRGRPCLHLPWVLWLALRRCGLRVEASWRAGGSWPRATAVLPTATPLGGAYLLVARKWQGSLLPLRPPSRRAAATRMSPAALSASRRHRS